VAIAASRGVVLQAAGIEEARLESEDADAVTAWHVLEHLQDPGAALDRVHGWIRPGGALLLGVPNVASLQSRVAGGRWLHLDVPRHRHHFTPAGVERLLAAHGFTVARSHRLLIEHNLFGMWQSWLDRFTSTPAYAYKLVKRNAELSVHDVAITLALTAAAPLAFAIEICAELAGRGGTLAIVARRT
jgi:predicted SAM-dependent methyltransferase